MRRTATGTHRSGLGVAGKGAGNGTRTRGLNLGKVACYHYTMPAEGNAVREGRVEAVPPAGAFKCSNGGGQRQSGVGRVAGGDADAYHGGATSRPGPPS